MFGRLTFLRHDVSISSPSLLSLISTLATPRRKGFLRSIFCGFLKKSSIISCLFLLIAICIMYFYFGFHWINKSKMCAACFFCRPVIALPMRHRTNNVVFAWNNDDTLLFLRLLHFKLIVQLYTDVSLHLYCIFWLKVSCIQQVVYPVEHFQKFTLVFLFSDSVCVNNANTKWF